VLAPELLSQIRRLELRARHLASDVLMGEYASAFKGRGWEFDEVREYRVGDDLRSIDWNVTARFGEPYVKVFREEREMTIMLLLDVSSSLFFAGGGRAKHEMAAELAAILAFLAIRHQDKVGLILFSDHVEHYIAPSKGRAHVWSIIRGVLSHRAKGQKTDVEGALRFFLNVRKRRCLSFLISDFWAPAYGKSLKQVARQHDLVCTRLLDPRERQLPDAGLVLLQDNEDGKRVLIDTSGPRFKQGWSAQQQKHMGDWVHWVRSLGASSLLLSTDQESVPALHRFLQEREARRRRP
jgi:uncharacterized protein (DUF58 family)